MIIKVLSQNILQLDIIVDFEVEPVESEESEKENVGCGGGARERTKLGPFGLLVIADDSLSELTPIFFRQHNSTTDGDLTTFFCADETRSGFLISLVFLLHVNFKTPTFFSSLYQSSAM